MNILNEENKHKIFNRINKDDLYVGGLTALSTLFIWIFLGKESSFNSILLYGDGFKYAFVSKHFYNSVNSISYNSVLPLTPTILFILRKLCFGSLKLASAVYILVTGVLASIAFFRFLITMEVKSPRFLACVFSVFPIKYLIIRSVLNSDSLFLFLVFISLIGVKIQNRKIAFIALSLSILTNYQGIVLAFSIFIFQVFSDFQKKRAFSKRSFLFLLPLVFLIPVQMFQYISSKSLFSLFKEKYVSSNEFCIFPFQSFVIASSTISNLGDFHPLFIFYLVGIIGLQFLSKSLLLYIVGITFYFYSFFLNIDTFFDNTILFETLIILIGFNSFYLSSMSEMKIFLLIYSPSIIWFSYKNIIQNSTNSKYNLLLLK